MADRRLLRDLIVQAVAQLPFILLALLLLVACGVTIAVFAGWIDG